MGFAIFLSFLAKADGISSIYKTNQWLKKGDEALRKKDYSAAARSFESALKEDIHLPAQTNYNLGLAYYQMGNFEKAQKNYMTAATTIPSPALKSISYQQIGNIFSKKKEYKAAMDWYRKSLKANPENQSARINYELAYKLNQAVEASEKQKKPDNQKQDNSQKKEDEQKKQENQSNNQPQKGDENQNQKSQNGKDDKGQDKNKKAGQDNKSAPGGKDGKEDQQKEGDSKADSKSGQKKDGMEEQEDKNSKALSEKKGQESDQKDPEAVRMDKKKLAESGLSEAQAKSLLQAMQQSEIKYLQQRRFGRKKSSSGKVKW